MLPLAAGLWNSIIFIKKDSATRGTHAALALRERLRCASDT